MQEAWRSAERTSEFYPSVGSSHEAVDVSQYTLSDLETDKSSPLN